MKRVNEIDIKITKAIVTSIGIELDDDQPRYTVKGWLVSEHGLRVSEFMFWSNSYGDTNKIEIPIEIHRYSAEIFKAMTPVIHKKINGMYKELPAPKEASKK